MEPEGAGSAETCEEMIKGLLLKLLLYGCLFSLGCAPGLGTYFPFDFEGYQDRPIPEKIAQWLDGGSQTAITPRIVLSSLSPRLPSRQDEPCKEDRFGL